MPASAADGERAWVRLRGIDQLLFDLLLLLNGRSQKSVQDFVSLSPAIASDHDLTFAKRTSSLLTVVGYHCLP